ncbi:MAG: hypothetical protein KDJ55_02330 [Rhodobiaceae bacterium]|nr:hypothetical protein [Rhodobiaceae bacterium]
MRVTTGHVAAILSVAVFVALGIGGAGHGYAPDGDSVRLFDTARIILDADYKPSRSSGYPAFEAMIALVVWLGGGVRAVSIVVMAMWLATAAILTSLALPDRRWAAPVVLLLTPVVLVNSSWPMETGQAALLTVLYMAGHLNAGGRLRFAAMAITGTLLVLTRIDACFAIVALGLAGLISERDWQHFACVAVIGVVTFAIYALLNDGLSFLGPFNTPHESVLRHFAKAAIISYLMLAFIGFAAGIAVLNRWNELEGQTRWALGLLALLWGARLVILPEELEYLIIPYVMLLVWYVRLPSTLSATRLLAIAIVSNLFAPVLFERPDRTQDQYRLTFALGAPPVVQDFHGRKAYNEVLQSGTTEYIRAQSGMDIVPSPFHDWMFTPQRDGIVIFADALYAFRSQRSQSLPRADLSQYSRIVLCDGLRLPTRGWRWMQRHELPHVLEAKRTGKSLNCHDVTASEISRQGH